MPEVRVFVNGRQKGAASIETELHATGVPFVGAQTSGPTTIWIDGRPSYGVPAVRRAIGQLQPVTPAPLPGQPRASAG